MKVVNPVTALLVSADPALARQFAEAIAQRRLFRIVGQMDSYPSPQALVTRLRQVRPEVLLLDVATDLQAAAELTGAAVAGVPGILTVGLHHANDAQAILTVLRQGATEFLYAPFEADNQEAAVTRLQKLLAPVSDAEQRRGKVLAFAGAKRGSGVSTVVLETGYALEQAERKRVLLIDLNLYGGILAFLLRLQHHGPSVQDLLDRSQNLSSDAWEKAVTSCGGLDLLPAPLLPADRLPDAGQIVPILEHARRSYDWILLDLPCIFERFSLGCVSESDQCFLVTTPDLANLHLARRAVRMLRQLGFDKDRMDVLVNRMESRGELTSAELRKLFDCDIDKGLPMDPEALHIAQVDGRPVGAEGALGKAIQGLAVKIRQASGGQRQALPLATERPVLTQI